MSEAETRLDILLAIIRGAHNFKSLNEDGELAPMSFQEAMICAQLGAEYVASGKVPTDEDWERYEPKINNAMAEAETTSKH